MAEMRLDSADDILREAAAIAAAQASDLRSFLYQEILLNALKCKRDELDILDLKLLSRAVAEFRYAARVFKPYRGVRKVSIFGSARTPRGDPYYDLAVAFGRALVERDFMVITGAAEGIMRAGIEGAGPQNSFGVNILLPFERAATDLLQEDGKLITFRYFFTRKLFFVMEADAFALFPGGFGTHDEGFELLTLLQTGKTPPKPLVLMELPGERYWERWESFVRQELLSRGYISPEDLSFYKIAHSSEEGVAWLTSYYSTYHSLRQVGDLLVIRLERDLADGELVQLTRQFGDLIEAGRITRTGPLPPEEDQPALRSKPRIAFRYQGQNAGRLNELILAINQMGSAGQPEVLSST